MCLAFNVPFAEGAFIPIRLDSLVCVLAYKRVFLKWDTTARLKTMKNRLSSELA